jgi:signal-transduction protein with cAMP-binding, CBS, and nucleotidyltransferase domain
MFQNFLLKVPLMWELQYEELISIIQNLTQRVYMPGEIIYYKGQICEELLFVQKGKIKVGTELKDKSQLIFLN